jgi:3-hydroxyisobutyrate dehydrogenase-like beta-hydroxyacid dehydrogenase
LRSSPAKAAAGADFVITMLTTPETLEQVRLRLPTAAIATED